MVFRSIFAGILLSTLIFDTSGQTFSITFDLHDLLRKNQFETFNRQISWFSEEERKVIHLPEKEGYGIAWLRGTYFSEGTVEVDIRTTDMPVNSAGIAFHGVDNDTMLVVCFGPSYLPPVDPEMETRKVNYLPLPFDSGPETGENFSSYFEKPVNSPDEGKGWLHVKISVRKNQITVFVDNLTDPVLDIEKPDERKSGKIGFWVSDNSGGDFANLKISTSAGRNLKNPQRDRKQ